MKISYCGTQCHICEAYQATITNDDSKRKEVAQKWSKTYSQSFKEKDINCNGCKSKKTKFSYCSVCKVRLCCEDKQYVHCGQCDMYPCKSIEEILKFTPKNKQILDAYIN